MVRDLLDLMKLQFIRCDWITDVHGHPSHQRAASLLIRPVNTSAVLVLTPVPGWLGRVMSEAFGR